MKYFVLTIVAYALLTPSAAHAEQRSVDLDLQSEQTRVQVEPGQLVTLRLTMKNNGPNTAIAPSAVSSPYLTNFPDQQFTIVEVSTSPPCHLHSLHLDPRPGNPVTNMAHLWYPSLAPGEGVTCAIGLLTTPAGHGNQTVTFTAFDGRFFPTQDVLDGNDENNGAAIQLSFVGSGAPVSVPTGGGALMVVLSILILTGGALSYRSVTPDSFHD